MSKGDSPRPTKKPLPTPKPKPTLKGESQGGVGSGGGTQTPPECWNFPLGSPTPGARLAKQGMPVVGIPQGARVMVQGAPGVLGYAPNSVAVKMIAALARAGGRLGGQVLSKSAAHDVEIQLCIS